LASKNDHISALTALLINKELHFAVYTASSLPTLVSIIEGLWLRVGPSIGLDLTAVDRLARGHAEKYHAQLVSAIAEKDSTTAREAVVSDIRTSVEYIIATGALPRA
jgi:DNA-binding GntR family transcriptional regulator